MFAPGSIRKRMGLAAMLIAMLLLASLTIVACGLADTETADMAFQTAQEYEDEAFYEEDYDIAMGEAAEGDNGAAYASNASAVQLDERKLVFTGDMSLRVEDTLVALAAVTEWAEAHDAFIEQSSTYDRGDGVAARLTLRVPSESFEDARAHLRSLAVDVLSDEKQRQDVTGRHADYTARLTNLKAAENELREFLSDIREQGGTAEEVMEIHRELTRVRGEIESLQAQLNVLDEQIAYSTINASFEPVPAEPEIVSDSWHPQYVLRRAAGDLIGGLQNLIDAGIYFTVALLPLLLVLAVVLWVLHKLYRRIRPKGSRQQPSTGAAKPADNADK